MVSFTGEITPAPARAGVKVALYKRVDGAFKLVRRNVVELGSDGRFVARFERPRRHGTCRVRARYEGDPSYLASRDALTFRC